MVYSMECTLSCGMIIYGLTKVVRLYGSVPEGTRVHSLDRLWNRIRIRECEINVSCDSSVCHMPSFHPSVYDIVLIKIVRECSLGFVVIWRNSGSDTLLSSTSLGKRTLPDKRRISQS
jgi:hypothetical protein